ncbi:bifunctional diguanylate cyclase/phosphodiesterase [Cryobacterium sp. TMT1-21]|uniref:Bifunctional diguanylate cyclase/phosphodiesterase n=1 Tax=Cryobacterium shii TaxID=1259235 RepID=A0AAQ2C678_9MICO|nr:MULTISPECIES: EAL domain-containing protein [Cryobacterium]TFC47069.1 bifunctional diguanylate cyclase/phosphodiesterase [Cryobacterium shii]TFC88174.1 bifunctional diguanylate cyclase/phosphodiesterase [Cryobacterium sp. TmT2-59]TFD15299.1 bifunctional diguanylate cyclase/phosphodiesterase [Cryobacterium sp. TMT1-21]TFD17162.1 bifunctional diguanylate cyclase/phosphodiesterase [Cryobacterium sp. TMT2-23]TFD18089.1 bifunctional diguanylate cyclase/phosphodiesterase [Cryobacterium sp. TMT4-1
MRVISRVGAASVGVLGLIVLVGWYLGVATVPDSVAGLWTMKPMPALAFVLLAVAVLALDRRRAVLGLGLAVGLIGGLTLAEYILGASLGIDVLLPGIDFGGQAARMAPATAMSLLLLGASVVASRFERTTVMLTLVLAALGVSLVAVLGYAYGVSSLYTVAGLTSMALPTALALAVLSVSIMLQRPSLGLSGLLRDRGSAGRLLRQVIPFLVFGPFLLGWLRLWAEREGWFGSAFGVALLIMSMTLLSCALVWVAARRLLELDRQRDGAMQALAEANHTLEATVESRTHQLAETADTLHALIKIAPVGIVQLNAAGGLVDANDRWLALSGLTKSQSRSDGWASAIHPDDTDRVLREWQVAAGEGAPYETSLRFYTPTGQVNWVQVSTAPIRDAGGVIGHLATVTDVTALRMAENAASAASARFEAAFDSSPLGTAIVSLDGTVLEANRRLLDLAGRSSPVVNEPIEAIFLGVEVGGDGDEGGEAGQLVDGAVNAPSTRQRLDRRMRRADAEETWVKVSIAEIQESEETGQLLYQLEDITARRLAEARVEHLAFHDPLTNLPNRLLLLDRLNQALLQASRRGLGVAVLFLDLDRFKFVNDSLGHQAGDAVLTEVGIRLRQSVRSTDTVSRIGGDEFVVICPDVGSGADVEKIAETIQRAIAIPIAVGEQTASVDASIGIAFGLGQDDAETLLHNADQAMYLAKGRGRARYEIFDDDLRTRIHQRLDSELALRDAVELGEIETWYQPIVDLQQNTVVATEALARWRRPARGVIQPGDFIAIAEEVGLIKQIGTEVLGQACRAANALERGMAVSVNVSARQFVQDDFGQVVKRALDESGLPPEQLWLELTESAVLEAIDSAAKTFQELRGLGVRLAIDDFGTGYSSFTHLRAFTVDLLKIDLTFIRDLERSQHDRAIVEGILRLADSLHVDVVAEGIETTNQRDLLKAMGCRFGQGYLFSKPAPSVQPMVQFVH